MVLNKGLLPMKNERKIIFSCVQKKEIIKMNNAKNVSIAVNLSMPLSINKISTAANKNPVKFYSMRIPQTSKL